MSSFRAAGFALVALTLAGCAGGSSPLGEAPPAAPPAADVVMSGRWILSAPNAPACGMNFAGAPGAREGTVAPEGGCPGRFFTSRHWTLDRGALTISDHENNPLAQLSFTGGHFEGKSNAGLLVRLAR